MMLDRADQIRRKPPFFSELCAELRMACAEGGTLHCDEIRVTLGLI